MTDMNGAARITAERLRQIESEGWSPEHDDEHGPSTLEKAARCYHHATASNSPLPQSWPFGPQWWKPKDRVRNLERAGALYQAAAGAAERAGFGAWHCSLLTEANRCADKIDILLAESSPLSRPEHTHCAAYCRALEQSRDSLLEALQALLEHEGTVVVTGIGEFPSEELDAARKQSERAISAAEDLKASAENTEFAITDFVAWSGAGEKITALCKIDLRLGDVSLINSTAEEAAQARDMKFHCVLSESGREFSVTNFGGEYQLADLKGFHAQLSETVMQG